MTRIDRAAWKRIKARMAQYTGVTVSGVWVPDGAPQDPMADIERVVTVFKGRSCGFTQGLLEHLPGVVDELRFADGNRLKASGPRAPAFKGRSVGPSTRFSAEELFRNNDQVTYLAQRRWLRALLPAK